MLHARVESGEEGFANANNESHNERAKKKYDR
jgi:hypothetical protein